MRGTKAATLAIGIVGLAGALSFSAFAAPSRSARAARSYTPSSADTVVVHVPARDAAELAARRTLAEAPDRIEVALELARADIRRYRAESDPRYLGHAQATLARWWRDPDASPELRLVRATILQSIHEFGPARADLDRAVAARPRDVQAQLTRAVVATVTGDYAAARASCAAIADRASAVVVATCLAPIDGLGRPAEAARRLRDALAAAPVDPAIRSWALVALAELAIQRGDTAAAETSLRTALAIDAGDTYARAALADVLLATERAADVPALLAGRERIDALLLRRALAEHALGTGVTFADTVRARIAAAAERGDRIHLREEARFALAIEHDAPRAARIAAANWQVQKELADARLLAAAARASGDAAIAAPVVAWARANGVTDLQLARDLGDWR